MPSLLPHVLRGRSQVSLIFASVVSPVKGWKFSNTTVSYNLHVHIGLFCLTERVIAMSFPSTGIRALYRNPIEVGTNLI